LQASNEISAARASFRAEDRSQAVKPAGLLVSDFNADNLATLLNNCSDDPLVEVVTAPFGQVVPTLVNGELRCWQEKLDFVVVWTRPECILDEFRKALQGAEPVDISTLESQVDAFCELLLATKKRTSVLFVPTWAVPAFRQGHAMQDLALGSGVARIVMQINLRLLQNLDTASNIYALNTQKWMESAGTKAFNPRLWYLAKIPFGTEVFKAAVEDMKAALRGISGRARKLLILDLDDTLWGGIVGDTGWENLVLGGHDPTGEALVDFQQELKAMSSRGLLLGIVSKNEESIALEAIEKHPEMVLKLGDLAGWRINWDDKAKNIAELAADLNLGLDSVVFIDDNPVERDRIRKALPGVLVPEWPEDKRRYVQSLAALNCFASPVISAEDRQRSSMYVSERERTNLKVQIGSVEKWLESLEMALTIEDLNNATLPRATQLLNKTNQMNLSTRRMNEEQFATWATGPGRRVWLFRVSDRFGDSGLTGIASMECQERKAQVIDFILSCRVMGRRVEEAMLGILIEWARANGMEEIYAIYQPTAKNKPCHDFLRRSGLECHEEATFTWPCQRPYPSQTHIKLVDQAQSRAAVPDRLGGRV
jgi:FkbH-like protein